VTKFTYCKYFTLILAYSLFEACSNASFNSSPFNQTKFCLIKLDYPMNYTPFILAKIGGSLRFFASSV